MLDRFLEALTYAFLLVTIAEASLLGTANPTLIKYSMFQGANYASIYIILTFVMFSSSFVLRDKPRRHFHVLGLVAIAAAYLFTTLYAHPAQLVQYGIINDSPFIQAMTAQGILLDPFYIFMGFVGGALAILFAHFLYQRKQDFQFPVRTPIFLGTIMLFLALYFIAKAFGQPGTSDIFYIIHLNSYFNSGWENTLGWGDTLGLLAFPAVLAALACITLMSNTHIVIRVLTYILTITVISSMYMDYPPYTNVFFNLLGESGLLVGFTLFTLLALDMGNIIFPFLKRKICQCSK